MLNKYKCNIDLLTSEDEASIKQLVKKLEPESTGTARHTSILASLEDSDDSI
jgi:hypothetical protein